MRQIETITTEPQCEFCDCSISIGQALCNDCLDNEQDLIEKEARLEHANECLSWLDHIG